MSLNKRKELTLIANTLSKELRKKSTRAEKVLWGLLRNRKLVHTKFYRQNPLYYDINGKESFFIADFYCIEKRLVIELDGEYHRYRLEHDNERTMIIETLGITVIRFSNDSVMNHPTEIISKIIPCLK